jgi:Bacterial dnaA protein helix-turn-helix
MEAWTVPGRKGTVEDGAFFHVFLKSIPGRHIVTDAASCRAFVHAARTRSSHHGGAVCAFAVSSGEANLLLRAEEADVARIVQVTCQNHTAYMNKREGSSGRRFDGPFRARAIGADYLAQVVSYIHGLPDRLALSGSKGDVCTSRAEFEHPDPSRADVCDLLSFLAPKPEEAARLIARTRWQDLSATQLAQIAPIKQWRRSDRSAGVTRHKLTRPQRERAVERLVQAVSRRSGIDPAAVFSEARDRRTAQARALIAHLVRAHGLLTLREIGVHLGGRTASTLSESIDLYRQRYPAAFAATLAEALDPSGPPLFD